MGSTQGAMTFAGRAISFYDTNLRAPSMQRWSLNTQQLLPANFLLEVAYVGSRASGLRIGKNYDALPLKYLSTLRFATRR